MPTAGRGKKRSNVDSSQRTLELVYQSGFGNEFATEALPGALPKGQNSPQKVPYGLYTEQLSGAAFTAPRAANRRSWLYRIRPAVVHKQFELIKSGMLCNVGSADIVMSPNQLRWDPFPIPVTSTDFIDGLITIAGNGDPAMQIGMNVHLYVANRSMQDRFFYNADGELLLVPQQGELIIFTELGKLGVKPGEIVVIPRGIRFRVEIIDSSVRGYICENFGNSFQLPALGVIGANGLANPRDFLSPVAAFEDRDGKFELIAKFMGNLWSAEINHSPLDVVAWHGNNTPYKYDLSLFNTINTVSFDHPDPSIFTVLTSSSDTFGVANVDFVIFPPRWTVAEHTFRPPWFHRNVMSEYMGLIYGIYDAKATGFIPGGGSLHNCMSGHGPDAATFEKASKIELSPHRIESTLAFMFESRYVMQPTKLAIEAPQRQRNYLSCWQTLDKSFTGKP